MTQPSPNHSIGKLTAAKSFAQDKIKIKVINNFTIEYSFFCGHPLMWDACIPSPQKKAMRASLPLESLLTMPFQEDYIAMD